MFTSSLSKTLWMGLEAYVRYLTIPQTSEEDAARYSTAAKEHQCLLVLTLKISWLVAIYARDRRVCEIGQLTPVTLLN